MIVTGTPMEERLSAVAAWAAPGSMATARVNRGSSIESSKRGSRRCRSTLRHFSFLGECRPHGREILADEHESDPLCDDDGRARTELHDEIAAKVLAGLRR
jgi:hypothetical protein